MKLEEKMNDAQYRKIDAEIAKLIAESAKLNAETRWYPLLIASGLVSAITILVKIFL